MSHHQYSGNLGATRYILFKFLLNCTGASTAALPRSLLNFKGIRFQLHQLVASRLSVKRECSLYVPWSFQPESTKYFLDIMTPRAVHNHTLLPHVEQIKYYLLIKINSEVWQITFVIDYLPTNLNYECHKSVQWLTNHAVIKLQTPTAVNLKNCAISWSYPGLRWQIYKDPRACKTTLMKKDNYTFWY